jgi:P27 family predicted phage terminase small subunit
VIKATVDIDVRAVSEHEHWSPPATLPEQVHAVWRAAVDDLGGAGHMRASFLPVVEAYCEAIWLHAQAAAEVRKSGLLVKGIADRSIVNPAVRVQKDAAATILRYADALGFTPSARIRMALEEVAGLSVLASLNASLDAAG